LNEADAIARSTQGPVTIQTLVEDLRNLGIARGDTLLVHASLSALGWVCGGPLAVVLALEEVLGPRGTLLMPAHTSLCDPGQWENPPVPQHWWDTIRSHIPAFDPERTPTSYMGTIAETFRQNPGTSRSSHPLFSFCARGPLAEKLVGSHSLDNGLGEDSPLARLYEIDGQVLLLGVDHSSNTSLHLAEYRSRFPTKRSTIEGAPVIVDGKRQWLTYRDINLNSDDFPRVGSAFENAAPNALRRGRVGYGRSRLFKQRPLVDYAVDWLCVNRPLKAP
jgi:aminoglycoside 3-N-acetyltransferase